MPNLDCRVAVIGAAGPLGSAIVAAALDAGLTAYDVEDGDFASGAEVAESIRAVTHDGVDAVVDAGFLRQPPPVGDLASLDAAAWQHAAELPMRRALHVLQGAHLCLRESGGRIVVLLPSLVMSGAAGVVAWAAAAEAYRSLAKAAGRAWGSHGITLTCVLVPASLAADAIADRPGLQPPAMGRVPDLGTDVGPAVVALLDERFNAVTGLTIAVDGGVWMTS